MKKRPRKAPEDWQREDATRLLAIWDKRPGSQISQEAAAAAWGLGTQGLVWQYLSGTIPLNLEAAFKFARGLHCRVADFSPILARQIEAMAKLERGEPRQTRVIGHREPVTREKPRRNRM